MLKVGVGGGSYHMQYDGSPGGRDRPFIFLLESMNRGNFLACISVGSSTPYDLVWPGLYIKGHKPHTYFDLSWGRSRPQHSTASHQLSLSQRELQGFVVLFLEERRAVGGSVV